LGVVPITSRYYLQEYIMFQLPPAIIYKNIHVKISIEPAIRELFLNSDIAFLGNKICSTGTMEPN
jgi:hypothetical protein